MHFCVLQMVSVVMSAGDTGKLHSFTGGTIIVAEVKSSKKNKEEKEKEVRLQVVST